MSSYRVTVERDGRFWFVAVEDVGVTQARHLREVDAMARDLVASMLDVDPGDVELDVQIRMPDEVRAHLDASVQLRNEASKAQSRAAEELRAAARQLADDGLPMRDIGALLGVSHQRAHQLVHDAREKTAS